MLLTRGISIFAEKTGRRAEMSMSLLGKTVYDFFKFLRCSQQRQKANKYYIFVLSSAVIDKLVESFLLFIDFVIDRIF